MSKDFCTSKTSHVQPNNINYDHMKKYKRGGRLEKSIKHITNLQCKDSIRTIVNSMAEFRRFSKFILPVI